MRKEYIMLNLGSNQQLLKDKKKSFSDKINKLWSCKSLNG